MRAVRNKRGNTATARLGWTEFKGQDVRSPWAEIADGHARSIVNMEKVGGYWKTEPGLEQVADLSLPQIVTDGYDLSGHSRVAACWWGDWFISAAAPDTDEIVITATKSGVTKVAKSDCVPSTKWRMPTGWASALDLRNLLSIELFPLPDRVLIRFGKVNSKVDCYAQFGADGNWRWWPVNWDAPKVWKYSWTGAGGNFEEWAFAFELVRKDSLGVIGATTPRAEMFGGSSSLGGWTPNASAATVLPVAFISDSAGTNTVDIAVDLAEWNAMVSGNNRGWTHFRVWRTRRLSNNGNPAETVPGNLQEWFLCREYSRSDVAFQRDANGVIQGNDLLSGAAKGTTFTYSELSSGDSQEVVGANAPTNVTAPFISLRSLPDVWDCCVASNLLHSIHRYSSELRDGDAVTAVPFSGYYAFRWNPADYARVSSATQGDLTAIEEHQGDVYAFKNNSTHLRPLGDVDLPFRLVDDMVGVPRFDKCRNTPLGIVGICSDDTLRLLRGGAWVERLAAASLSAGIPTDVHDRTISARTWISHNSSQVIIRTLSWNLGYPVSREHVWHHGQFGGLSESDVASSQSGVTSTAQAKGVTWWGSVTAWRKSDVPGSDTTTDGTATAATNWSITTALLGNRKEPRHYDFKYASALVSATSTTLADVLQVGGGLTYNPANPDSDASSTTLFAGGTPWAVTATGGNPLAIDPAWKGDEQREIRYYPNVTGTSNAVDFTRHRVYGTALALRLRGTGPVALHSYHAEVRVSEGSNFDAMRRPSQTDWTNLQMGGPEILPVGIHDLETEPWTWS